MSTNHLIKKKDKINLAYNMQHRLSSFQTPKKKPVTRRSFTVFMSAAASFTP